MTYRYLSIVLIICFLASCTSLPEAAEDQVVLTKKTKSTRMGTWANVNANDFATWKILDVEEYGHVPSNYFIYNPKIAHHYKANSPLGIKTLNSSTWVVPKMIPGELAGKIEYWLSREIRNTFYEKVHVTKELSPIFQPNPKVVGDVFYFEDAPMYDMDRFAEALTQSGLKASDVKEVIAACSYVKGKGINPNTDIATLSRNTGIMNPQWWINHFHEECYENIIKYTDNHKMPSMFSNSKFIVGGSVFTQYSDELIKQVIDYEKFNQGWYDAGFLAHLKGKYGMDIRENLKQNVFKGNLYNQDKLRVTVILSDATQLLSELNFVDDQYFFNQKSHMNWTSHILNKVFGKNNAKELYRDYPSRVDATGGINQYSNSNESQDVLKRLKAKCNFDLDKVQLAYKAVSRFEMDCLHQPIETGSEKLNEQDYQSYTRATTKNDAENNVISSHVTIISLQEEENIQGGVAPTGVNMTAIQFELEKDYFEMGWNYINATDNGGLVDGKVDPLQPESDFLSNFALTLAKNFPPNALISWLPELSEYGYVFHHGILWRFPVIDIRSHENEIEWQQKHSATAE